MDEEHTRPKWIDKIFQILPTFWQYHVPCKTLDMGSYQDENTGIWNLKIAPVFQEVYGGEADGKKVWAGFVFNVGNFSRAERVEVQEYMVVSACSECNNHPKLLIMGKYRGHHFCLHVFMEPLSEGPTVEMIDTKKQEVTPIQQQPSEGENT